MQCFIFSESSSLSKRDYLSASERSESGYVIKASVSAASCEEKLVRKGIGEDVKVNYLLLKCRVCYRNCHT